MSELQEKLLEIKNQKDTYIIPENLKKNVTAFGVTGTYEGSGGSGDVKLFDTVEHMQADPNPLEGDLAVVYRNQTQPITADSEFSSCTFPNTVVLSTAFSSEIYGRFRSTGDGWFDGNVELSSSSFRFNGYGEGDVRVTYTSEDGITYTRTDGGEESQEFGTTIKWEEFEPWNDVIGNFMLAGGMHFEGMYEYTKDVDMNKIKLKDFLTSTITISNNTTSEFIVPNSLPTEYNIDIINSIATKNNLNYLTLYLDTDDNVKIINSPDNYYSQILVDSSGAQIGLSTDSAYNSTSLPSDVTVYTIDLNTGILSDATTYTPFVAATFSVSYGDYTYYGLDISNVKSLPIQPHPSESYKNVFNRAILKNATTWGASTDNFNLRIYQDKYTYAPTQFTLKDPSDLYTNVSGYGANGVVVSDGSIWNKVTASDIGSIFKFSGSPKENIEVYGEGENVKRSIIS